MSRPTKIKMDRGSSERLEELIFQLGGIVKSAEIIGVDPGTTSRWARRYAPNFRSLQALARIGVDLNWLLTGRSLTPSTTQGNKTNG